MSLAWKKKPGEEESGEEIAWVPYRLRLADRSEDHLASADERLLAEDGSWPSPEETQRLATDNDQSLAVVDRLDQCLAAGNAPYIAVKEHRFIEMSEQCTAGEERQTVGRAAADQNIVTRHDKWPAIRTKCKQYLAAGTDPLNGYSSVFCPSLEAMDQQYFSISGMT